MAKYQRKTTTPKPVG